MLLSNIWNGLKYRMLLVVKGVKYNLATGLKIKK